MDGRKIGQQFHAMFSIFMVFFYLGFGFFFLFYSQKFFIIDKAVRNIFGTVLLLLGILRIYTTYKLIVKAFFTKEDE
jgi:hypothetical protein